LQYIYKGGTTNAVFADYLEKLIEVCREKYEGKIITIVCDNLRSHKCTEVLKVVQKDDVELVFLTSYSPEYSAIESLFGWIKNRLKDVIFDTKEKLANKITALAKMVTKEEIQNFYRLTFNEMLTFFYSNQNRISELLKQN